ncbi:MAG: hypothetical protein COT73_02410, partial [Bdellovibrio sp. CG10_big_fil_rev_8_21_14_0_10_47_8]
EKEGFRVDPTWSSSARPDATKRESYKNLPAKIDAAIYLAGINAVSEAENITDEIWDKVFDVNLKGALYFAQAAFPALKAAKPSCFISISSIMVTHPYPNRIPYAASKAGLESLTRCLAVEWGKHGISSHTLRLGHISGLMKSTVTNPKLLDAVKKRIPAGELIQTDQVASYIAWLAKGGAKSVNGTVIDFDPAYTINRWPLDE